MLDPEYLERAGTLVGSVYSQIEAEMCDRLVRDMLAGDISDWHDQRTLALLAQGEAPKLRAILEQHRGDIDEAVRREVEEALERSDAHDLRVLKEALGVDLPGIMPMQVLGAVRTVTQMLERDNVAMLSGARDLFYNQSAWAVTQAATGVMGYDEAIRRATRELARKGIDVIQYKDPQTGNLTVRSAADVAVTRHVRSQLSQQCAARTMQVCQQVGCEFVEVSSHFGARPSHQDWEGRRYHVGGRVTVDGVTYEDFAEATGYYGTGGHGALGDRLCGVNCRHQFGPWMPGMPHAYEPNPQHPSGKSNEEIYRLTQRQRRLERAIRASKREVAAAERAYEADPTLKNQTTANQLREQLRKRQDALAKLVDENKDVLARDLRREWAGDMPKVKVPTGSARSVSDYLAQPSVARDLEDAGISKARIRRSLSEVLATHEIDPRKFAQLPAAEQDAFFTDARRLEESRPAKKARRKRMTTEPVNLDYVDSEHFERQFAAIEGPKTRETVVRSARSMLRHRNRTVYEDLYAIECGSGDVLAMKVNDKTPHAVALPMRLVRRLGKMREGSVIMMHNHPQSMPPSVSDFRTCLLKAVRHGIIVCHDGRAFTYGVVDAAKFSKAIETREGWERLDRTLAEMVDYFGDEAYERAIVPTLEANYGITYSRLRG